MEERDCVCGEVKEAKRMNKANTAPMKTAITILSAKCDARPITKW